MDRKKLQDTQAWVRGELDRCANFWLEHGMDRAVSYTHLTLPTN